VSNVTSAVEVGAAEYSSIDRGHHVSSRQKHPASSILGSLGIAASSFLQPEKAYVSILFKSQRSLEGNQKSKADNVHFLSCKSSGLV
jgi:hypothetical protein